MASIGCHKIEAILKVKENDKIGQIFKNQENIGKNRRFFEKVLYLF